jgi:hypothetical protein
MIIHGVNTEVKEECDKYALWVSLPHSLKLTAFGRVGPVSRHPHEAPYANFNTATCAAKDFRVLLLSPGYFPDL